MATKLQIKNLPQGFQTIINNGRHGILADEPIKSKGTDLGFSPPELLLASIGMCKAATVRYIARREGWDDRLRDVDATLEQVVRRDRDTGKLRTRIKVELHIEGDLTDTERAVLVREADACYIHRMIEGEWDIQPAVEVQPTSTAPVVE